MVYYLKYDFTGGSSSRTFRSSTAMFKWLKKFDSGADDWEITINREP